MQDIQEETNKIIGGIFKTFLNNEYCIRKLIETFFTKNEFLLEAIEYNVSGGKETRKKLFLKTVDLKKRPQKNKTANLFLSFINEIIGDTIEMVQGSFVIIDDIMDEGEIRRNKKCWYILHGNKTIKQAQVILTIISMIYVDILPKLALYLEHEFKYNIDKKFLDELGYEMQKLYSKVLLMSSLGQVYDGLDKKIENWNDIENILTKENYEQLCVAKNSFYTFIFPVYLGFEALKLNYHISNDHTKENEKFLADKSSYLALCYMGILHQVRDDLLNFLPSKSGKSNLDLEGRKLTYFIYNLIKEGKDNEVLEYLIAKNKTNTLEIKKDEEANMIAQIRMKIQKYIDSFDQMEHNLIDKIQRLANKNNTDIIQSCISILKK